MPNIKTTISIESSNLFPAPLKLVKSSSLIVTSDQAVSQRHEIEPAASEVLFDIDSAAGKSGLLYFYATAELTNSAYGLDLIIENKGGGTAIFSKLLPGDVAYLPVYAKDDMGIKISVRNCDPAQIGAINYIYWFKD